MSSSAQIEHTSGGLRLRFAEPTTVVELTTEMVAHFASLLATEAADARPLKVSLKLREMPGWGVALHEARKRFEHVYDMQTFLVAGELSVPELPREASVSVVKAALGLADALKRFAAGGGRQQPKRFELAPGRPDDSNVIRVSIGIDSSGVTYARSLSCAQVREELRRAKQATLYRLTHKPIANDNDPAPGRSFSHPLGWPSPRSEAPALNVAPGLVTLMQARTVGPGRRSRRSQVKGPAIDEQAKLRVLQGGAQ